ncbi:MAG: PhoU domain-containing protein [Desulfuromonadales bacterium]
MDSVLSYLTVSRHLERVADLATNIAEDVIYLNEGEIVRHRGA